MTTEKYGSQPEAQSAIMDLYNSPRAWNTLAEAYAANGRYDEAERIAKEVKRMVTLFDLEQKQYHARFYERCLELQELTSIAE